MADAKATFALVGQDQTAAAFASALGATQVFAAKAAELLKGAFAIGGVSIAVDFVKSFADMGENLEKGAVRAGLAQSQFSQLAAAFGQADISAESLSKGIKNMQIALSKATNGDDTLASAFNDIGLSAASLKQLAPDVQLLAIAEALSKIQDPADRARIGTQLLGKQFLELEPQLQKGAEGLGAIINAAHGMTDEDVARLAKFAQQMNSMGQSLKLFAAGAVADIASFGPGLKDVFSSDLEIKINAIQRALANPGNFDASTLDRMKTQLAALQAQADAIRVKPPADNIAAALSEQGKGQMEAAVQAILKAELDAHTAEEDMDMKAAAARSAQLDQELKDTETHGEKRVDFEAKIDDLIAAGRITAYEGFKRLYAQDQAASNAAADAAAKAQNSGAIEAAIQGTQKQFAESADAMAAKNRAMTDLMREDWQKTQDNAKQAAASIEDSFATFLVNPFSGGLKKMLSAWVQTIDQMVAKAAAQSIFKSLFGDTGLSSVFSAFLTGGTTGGSAANVDLNSNNVSGHATGASWKVGGSGGTDSQLVRFRASPDETVSVTRPGQNAGSAPSVIFSPTYQFGSGVNRTDVVQACAATQKSTIAEISKMIRGGRFG